MKKRYPVLDEIRGITLCSMILYHTVWDLVYMFGVKWEWYHTDFAYIWQQSICWSFILLSGFCFSMGKVKWKRGCIVFGAGVLISLVTEIFMPEQRIRFGVLTLLGSSMLVMESIRMIAHIWHCRKDSCEEKKEIVTGKNKGIGPDYKEISKNKYGMIISATAFLVTKRINDGYLGFSDIKLASLPQGWYQKGDFGTFLGFTERTFYSTDYFSFMPWFFLFLTGYFLYGIFQEKDWLSGLSELPSMGKVWRFLGRNSLLIYLLHQPIIYVVLLLIFSIG